MCEEVAVRSADLTGELELERILFSVTCLCFISKHFTLSHTFPPASNFLACLLHGPSSWPVQDGLQVLLELLSH